MGERAGSPLRMIVKTPARAVLWTSGSGDFDLRRWLDRFEMGGAFFYGGGRIRTSEG